MFHVNLQGCMIFIAIFFFLAQEFFVDNKWVDVGILVATESLWSDTGVQG